MNVLSKLIKFFIGLPLALIALFFIARLFLTQKHILSSLTHANLFLLLAAMGCFLVYFFLRSFFWQKLLFFHNVYFSLRESSFVWGMSELKRYVPGNVWSFISRTSQHSDKGHDKKIIIKGLLQETLAIVFGSIIVSLFSLNFLIFAFLPHFPLQKSVPAIITLLVSILIIGLIFHARLLPNKPKLIKNLFPSKDPWAMTMLLFTMSGAFFFFGLGTFFAIDAIFPLYLPHILPFTGFFTFSLLVGYLSFITPMGLGVREAIITAGVAKYTTVAQAALGAIFARLIFIASELLFLAICWVWVKAWWAQKVERFIAKHKYEIALIAVVLLYIFYFTLATFLRYINFYTGRFDLGNMDQTVWNTVHGRFFQTTNPDGIRIITRLAFHADYMLALLSPFYFIWQDPRMLLLIQSISLGIGGFLVYAIAQKIVKKKLLSFILAVSYLLYPAINHANLFDFHAITLAVPLFLASWYFLLKKNYVVTIIFLLLAGTTKEEVWLIVALCGVWIAWVEKQKITGIVLTIFSLGFFYYLFWHAIPIARGGEHFALSYYSDFGSNPTTVVKNILFSPKKLLSTVLGNGRPLYLFEIFAPTAFLSLLAFPFLLFTLPDFGVDLLSQNSQLHTINYHYAAIFAPFIFIATIYAVRFLLTHQKIVSYKLLTLLLAGAAVACAYGFGPLPGALHMNSDMFTKPVANASQVDNFLQAIPHKYSVAATNNVGSHLSHRQRIYTIPTGIDSADIVVMLLNDPYAQPSLASQKKLAEDLTKDKRYTTLVHVNDFIVFKKITIPIEVRKPRSTFFPIFGTN